MSPIARFVGSGAGGGEVLGGGGTRGACSFRACVLWVVVVKLMLWCGKEKGYGKGRVLTVGGSLLVRVALVGLVVGVSRAGVFVGA